MLAERPTQEAVVARYERMRHDVIAELGAELGEKLWEPSPSSLGNLTAACTEAGWEGETVHLTLYRFTGTYGSADWQRSLDIVTEVAARYGFTTRTFLDRPGDSEIVGEDSYGGSYTFGMATNTTFGFVTGCHLPARLHPSG